MRLPSEGLIHHAGHGSQYRSVDDQAELRRPSLNISVSGNGDCYERHGRGILQDHQIRARLAHRILHPRQGRASQCRDSDGLCNPVRPFRARFHQPGAARTNRATLNACLSIQPGQVRRSWPRRPSAIAQGVCFTPTAAIPTRL